MITYKIDTHVHTAEISPCGYVKAKDLVHLYKRAGYDGIVITDHYYKKYFDSLDYKTWEDKIEHFMTGYKNAYTEGQMIGLKVFFGMEIRFEDSNNDYLVYGLDESYLKENPELYNLSLCDLRQITSGENILIYQAHPFRVGMNITNSIYLDGIEVFNGNPRHDSRNHLAYSYAKSNKLKMISGSDFHQEGDLATGGIIVNENIENDKKFVKVLCQNEILKLIRE